MDRKELQKKMNSSSISNTVDKIYRDNVLEALIHNCKDDTFKGQTNLIIAMEEASEFAKEVSKKIRGEESNIGLIEEIADMMLIIRATQLICGISDDEINKAMNVKLSKHAEAIGYSDSADNLQYDPLDNFTKTPTVKVVSELPDKRDADPCSIYLMIPVRPDKTGYCDGYIYLFEEEQWHPVLYNITTKNMKNKEN